MKIEITPEVIAALGVLRDSILLLDQNVRQAVDVLDNAGIFHLIDEATGYDVDPQPEQVSTGCPGDTAFTERQRRLMPAYVERAEARAVISTQSAMSGKVYRGE